MTLFLSRARSTQDSSSGVDKEVEHHCRGIKAGRGISSVASRCKVAFALLPEYYVRVLSCSTQALEFDEEVFGAAQGRVFAVGRGVGDQAGADEPVD